MHRQPQTSHWVSLWCVYMCEDWQQEHSVLNTMLDLDRCNREDVRTSLTYFFECLTKVIPKRIQIQQWSCDVQQWEKSVSKQFLLFLAVHFAFSVINNVIDFTTPITGQTLIPCHNKPIAEQLSLSHSLQTLWATASCPTQLKWS